ncbi:MAG TPA: ABC transporter permease [Pyrinomonadaceae bacterium]
MLKLLLSRSLQGIIVLLIVSMLTFALLAATGGDALTSLSNDPSVKEETIERLRQTYGLDQPLAVRYMRWLTNVVRGDLGESYSRRAPVWMVLRPALTNTLMLAGVALIIAWTIALALGSFAARRPRSWLDKLCSAVILLASSTPRIVLALAALTFAASTALFSIGAGDKESSPVNILLPATVLAVPLIALFLAQVRDGLGAALREEFVQVARAKGLSERAVALRHALRAALNPLITIFGYSLGGLVSGSVIVEKVLGWRGLGNLSVDAALSRDVPLLMGVVLLTATAVLIGNLAADILLRVNDPRLRQSGGNTRRTTSPTSASVTSAS